MVDNKSQGVVDLSQLEIGAAELQTKFNRSLFENPTFWKTTSEKGEFFTSIRKQVQDFWNKYGSKVDSEIPRLETTVNSILKNRDKLTEKLSDLDDQQTDIKKRLEEFESPIGKLTIGFDDLITFFPAALLAGFLVTSSMLVDTMRVRKQYFDSYKRTDENPALTDDQVILTAPLWLDPQDRNQKKSVRLLILFLPSIIFFVSVGLIIFSWNLHESSLGGDPAYRPVSAFLYLFSGIIVSVINFLRFKT